MMWQLQPMIAWMMSAQGSNLGFAGLCLLVLLGAPVRLVICLTILLHVGLALV